MTKYIYYTKDGKFETEYSRYIPGDKLHSPNEETPAIIYPNGRKEWWFEGVEHRLTGPAIIWPDDVKWFYLNGNRYVFEQWLKNHPNQDVTFQAFMKLKYS